MTYLIVFSYVLVTVGLTYGVYRIGYYNGYIDGIDDSNQKNKKKIY